MSGKLEKAIGELKISTQPKKAIGKKDFSLDSLKDKFSTKTKYKADRLLI